MFSDELKTVIDHLRNDRKIQAIKFVREVTRKSRPEPFALDSRARQDAEFNVEPHVAADIYSEFTAWAATNNIDLAAGKVQVEYLGLKKAKDLVEFIQLNLHHFVG